MGHYVEPLNDSNPKSFDIAAYQSSQTATNTTAPELYSTQSDITGITNVENYNNAQAAFDISNNHYQQNSLFSQPTAPYPQIQPWNGYQPLNYMTPFYSNDLCTQLYQNRYRNQHNN